MTTNELKEVLEKHRKWLTDEEGGECADLSGANLSRADLSGANLSGVVMEIENKAYSTLNRTPVNYEGFPAAVEAVAEYFEEIDERAKKVPQNVKERAKRASQYIIAQEIAKIVREVI